MANATMSPVPGYLLGAAAMTPLQRMTRIATEGVAGNDSRFRSMEAGKYLRDLLADKLIGDDGKIMEKVVIPRIMEQYAGEVLGSPVEDPGKGFSIMKAYNDWFNKTQDPDDATTLNDPPLTKDQRVSRNPTSPNFEGGGESGSDGATFGGSPDTGTYSGMQGLFSGNVNPQSAAMAALAGTNPVTGIISEIAGLASKYGTPIGMDNLDPHPGIATNALSDSGLDQQGQTGGGGNIGFGIDGTAVGGTGFSGSQADDTGTYGY